MNNFDNNSFGIVVYDVKYGEGFIIMNDNNDNDNKNKINNSNDLFKYFDTSKLGYDNSIWEIHGYALFKNNQLFFNSKTNREYDDIFNDGWNIRYFKYNIFNQNGKHYKKYEEDKYQIKYINKNKAIIISNEFSKL